MPGLGRPQNGGTLHSSPHSEPTGSSASGVLRQLYWIRTRRPQFPPRSRAPVIFLRFSTRSLRGPGPSFSSSPPFMLLILQIFTARRVFPAALAVGLRFYRTVRSVMRFRLVRSWPRPFWFASRLRWGAPPLLIGAQEKNFCS